MKKLVIAGVATVALVGTGLGVAAYAQGRHQNFGDHFDRMIERVQFGDQKGWHKGWRGPRHQLSAEDRAAFLDARIAAVKAGLKLSAEQEKLWGPVENTVRELGKKWSDRMAARRDEWQKRRTEIKDGKEPPAVDQLDRLRKRADALAERSADLKRFADAAQPLYATLDDGQKRRLQMLVRPHRAGMMHRWHRPDRGPDRDDGPRRG
ncbi:MAG: Spy/CpxP family protein refolding chaperone [Xanthobacteraceae bacterium]|nr:Spy/CpxP family protein refolding chaperone [Xanthobacteraceae bacterium]MCW5675558.1 Spy/CpxP family protein refolding chaperone [Xanthobacteraceae bacterium]